MNLFKQLFKTLLFILLVTGFTSAVNAQVKITGEIHLADSATISFPCKIKLGSYQGEKLRIVDSVELGFDMRFKFTIPSLLESGVYEIISCNSNGLSFVLTPASDTLHVSLTRFRDRMEISVLDNENKSFQEFNGLVKKFMKSTADIMDRKHKISSEHKTHTELGKQALMQLRREHDSLYSSFNRTLEAHRAKYPKTYTSRVLARIIYMAHEQSFDPQSPYLHDPLWAREHFLDSFPVAEPGAVNNPFFDEKINSFLSLFKNDESEAIKESIFKLINSCPAQSTNRNYLMDHFTLYFMESNMEELAVFIYDRFDDGCQSMVLEKTIKRIRAQLELKTGSNFIDLVLADINGNRITLSSLIGKGPVLVYFWASWCEHCLQETPLLYSIFKGYRKKGFQVFAIALDTNTSNWLNYVQEQKLDWNNVIDPGGLESSSAQLYSVYRTPTLFLYDRNGKLIQKNPSIQQLNTILDSLPEE